MTIFTSFFILVIVMMMVDVLLLENVGCPSDEDFGSWEEEWEQMASGMETVGKR
jgi:hypothetical protein